MHTLFFQRYFLESELGLMGKEIFIARVCTEPVLQLKKQLQLPPLLSLQKVCFLLGLFPSKFSVDL